MRIPWVASFEPQEIKRHSSHLRDKGVKIDFFNDAVSSIHYLISVPHEVIIIDPLLRPGYDYQNSQIANYIKYDQGHMDYSSVGLGLLEIVGRYNRHSQVIVADSGEPYLAEIERESLMTLCSSKHEYLYLPATEPEELYCLAREMSLRTRHF